MTLHHRLVAGGTQRCTHVVQQGKVDGIGAQISAKLNVMAFARTHGYVYVHEPFSAIAHLPHPDGHLAEAKAAVVAAESFFNMGAGELSWEAVPKGTTVCAVLCCYIRGLSSFVALASDLQQRYTASPVPRPPAIQSRLPPLLPPGGVVPTRRGLAVALHIRRGDVSELVRHRFTPDSFYSDVLDVLQAELPAALLSSMRVFLYSEGDPADFAAITSRHPSVALRLNGDVFESLHEMATSDVLVMARSSFSWVAGFYASGVVVYHRFGHQCLQGWVDLGHIAHNRRFGSPLKKLAARVGAAETHEFLERLLASS